MATTSAHERVAVIDLGTNTTRLLVADVFGGSVAELDRRTTITRLGEGVDATGRLGEPAIERVSKALAEYRTAIDELGATNTVAVATSAVRDASNGDDFRALVKREYDFDVRTISGDEEARLTFLGATGARPQTAEPVMVLDIGGGSTELVVGVPGSEPDFHVSTQAGAVRQTERHLADDPPTQGQISDMALEIQLTIEEAVPAELREQTGFGIAVAGTATSMASIEQELDPYDSERVHGFRLELGACERMLAMLAGQTVDQRRDVTGLHPDRAPTIVAGAVILIEAMRAFSLDWMETSEADILHGAAVTAAASP